MLDDEELRALACDIESDRVERKSALGSANRDKVAQAICAFANDLPASNEPGVVFIGVCDDGGPAGTPITDELLRELGGFRSDGNILPLPTLVVRKLDIDGQSVAVLIVAPSSDPPVRYKGRVYIRVGPRRAVASRDEERILSERRRSGDLPFDKQAAVGAAVSDLDLDFFRESYRAQAVSPEVIAENDRSLHEQLAALHLLTKEGLPTHAALLLISRDPRRWMPGAYVQLVRVAGLELTDPVTDQKEFGGPMGQLLPQLDDLAKLHIRIQTVIGDDHVESRRPDYPLVAVQQLVRNAVLHRSYETHGPVLWYWFEDRMEIHSPGGLYGRVSEESFGQAGVTDYRNSTLAEGLKVLGFVQRFGFGIALARRACADNGNPPPEFAFAPNRVLALLRARVQ